MIVRFYTDDAAQLNVYGEFSGGCVRNMGGVLMRGQSFGNIPYETLSSLRNGVIDWDNDQKTGNVLAPADPRNLTAPYPLPARKG